MDPILGGHVYQVRLSSPSSRVCFMSITPSFHIDVLNNHMFSDMHRLLYQCFDQKQWGGHNRLHSLITITLL